jgi:arylsulfatase A
LDRLASEGMTFTDAHTPSSVCTPTRYGLLTGRYCWRTRLKRGVQNGYGPPLIQQSRTTLPEFLRENGYATGIVGKWHLGLGFAKNGKAFDFSKPVDDGPPEHGFDFSHVIPASLDFPPYVYIRDGELTEFPGLTQPAQKFPAFLRKGERAPDFVMNDCLDDLLKQSQSYIRQHANADKPFFLYFPLTAPHKPVLPHPRFRGRTKLGPYGDFIVQVDWTVGQVLQTIDESKIAANTLVIYTSDNGSFMYRYDEDQPGHVEDETIQGYKAANHAANSIFRGTKADIWEAGHHVPFFARWPKTIKPGSKCSETVCLTDVFATAAQIVGKSLPIEVAPDSFGLLPLMQGRDWQSPRAPVIHHSSGGMFSIRDGKWKLVLGNGSGGRQKPRGKPFARPYQLFDMSQDIMERTNVIEQHTEIAERLEAACLKIRDSGGSR